MSTTFEDAVRAVTEQHRVELLAHQAVILALTAALTAAADDRENKLREIRSLAEDAALQFRFKTDSKEDAEQARNLVLRLVKQHFEQVEMAFRASGSPAIQAH